MWQLALADSMRLGEVFLLRVDSARSVLDEFVGRPIGYNYILALETLAAEGDFRSVSKVIRDKDYRPGPLSDQYVVLRRISELPELPLSGRLTASVAAGHKAMESLDDELVEDSVLRLSRQLDLADSLPSGVSIREDRIHARFSIYACLYHLHLYRGAWTDLIHLTEAAFLDFPRNEDLGGAFYQTCTNVARCMSARMLAEIVSGAETSLETLKSSHDAMGLAFHFGLIHSDDHKVKFKEYLRDTRMYHQAGALLSAARKGSRSTGDVALGLLAVSLRPHGKDKVLLITRNFASRLEELQDRGIL